MAYGYVSFRPLSLPVKVFEQQLAVLMCVSLTNSQVKGKPKCLFISHFDANGSLSGNLFLLKPK